MHAFLSLRPTHARPLHFGPTSDIYLDASWPLVKFDLRLVFDLDG